MARPDFCRVCGTDLKAGSQFCPRCGKVVTTVSTSSSTQHYETASSTKPSSLGSGQRIWGIDKRYIIIGLFILFMIAPIFPRQKVVEVEGTEMVTVTSMSTSYVVTYVTQVPAQGQQVTIKVWVGNVQSWTMGSFVIDSSQHIIRVDSTNEPGGTQTVTLTSYEGEQTVIRNVFRRDLTFTGMATVQGNGQPIVTPISTPVVTPVTDVQQQQSKHTQVITEHVSILQILLGY